jgi:exodeoxyribonuclease VII large subunit
VSRLSAARHRLTTARQRLDRGMQARVEALRQRLEGVQRHLSCVGHQSVLQRGYTFTTDRSGRVLRAAGEAQAAGSLVTHFPDGTVDSQVTGPERRPRRRRRIAGEAGLFDGRVP